jgi:hypothetical protein
VAAWLTILAAVLVPAACLLFWWWTWDWRGDGNSGLLAQSSAPLSEWLDKRLWHAAGPACQWAWADELPDVGGGVKVPHPASRFVLVRLQRPQDAPPEATLVPRGDGSTTSLSDADGAAYRCLGYLSRGGFQPVAPAEPKAAAWWPEGWIVLVFELPRGATGLRLRVSAFGTTQDFALTEST